VTDRPEQPPPTDDDLAAMEEWYRWHEDRYGSAPEPIEGLTHEVVTPREDYL
jgi:hypothetical protein